jgi:putative DNA primase/helicase
VNLTLLNEVGRIEKAGDSAALPAVHVPDLTVMPNSDVGNAERLHAIHGANIKYVSTSGQWLIWDGLRWAPDQTGAIVRMFVEVMRLSAKQAISLADSGSAQRAAAHALRSTNRAQVDAGLAMLQSIQGVSVSVSDLDADAWLIGATNGVVDLRIGAAIRPNRDQLITKSIGAKYEPTATCPTWEKFLHTVTRGDVELISFLQSAVGYTLTGTTSEQCLFFLFGTGQNGKGVFSETLKRLLGDYGQTAPETLFTRDKGNSASNDVARLAGARMAVAAELEEGAAFAESRIKALTGGDTITARFLHREFFDFPPTHKFWISGNHKPTVKGTDYGIWRRIRLIPFTVRITDEEKDPDLVGKLADELPGILNWALAGCLEWRMNKLQVPSSVKQATEDYRKEEDVIGQFLSDVTEESREERTLTTALYQAYTSWADREGIQPRFQLTARKFNRKIEEHGNHRIKSRGVFQWENLAMKS